MNDLVFIMFCLISFAIFFYSIYSETQKIKKLKEKGWKELLWSKDIASLSRQQKIDWFWFMIWLNISQYNTYVMYEKLWNNKYKILEINADNVEIIEDDNEKPRIEEIIYIKNEDWFRSIAHKKIMYVPTWTVVKEYNV